MASQAAAVPDALDAGRYTRVAIQLHWVIAALIVVNLVIGLFHDSFPAALRGSSMGFHKAAAVPRPTSFFGLFDVPRLPVPQTPGVTGFWHEAHEVMAFGIIGLLALHVAGALKHQLIDRDNELARILPGQAAR